MSGFKHFATIVVAPAVAAVRQHLLPTVESSIRATALHTVETMRLARQFHHQSTRLSTESRTPGSSLLHGWEAASPAAVRGHAAYETYLTAHELTTYHLEEVLTYSKKEQLDILHRQRGNLADKAIDSVIGGARADLLAKTIALGYLPSKYQEKIALNNDGRITPACLQQILKAYGCNLTPAHAANLSRAPHSIQGLEEPKTQLNIRPTASQSNGSRHFHSQSTRLSTEKSIPDSSTGSPFSPDQDNKGYNAYIAYRDAPKPATFEQLKNALTYSNTEQLAVLDNYCGSLVDAAIEFAFNGHTALLGQALKRGLEIPSLPYFFLTEDGSIAPDDLQRIFKVSGYDIPSVHAENLSGGTHPLQNSQQNSPVTEVATTKTTGTAQASRHKKASPHQAYYTAFDPFVENGLGFTRSFSTNAYSRTTPNRHDHLNQADPSLNPLPEFQQAWHHAHDAFTSTLQPTPEHVRTLVNLYHPSQQPLKDVHNHATGKTPAIVAAEAGDGQLLAQTLNKGSTVPGHTTPRGELGTAKEVRDILAIHTKTPAAGFATMHKNGSGVRKFSTSTARSAHRPRSFSQAWWEAHDQFIAITKPTLQHVEALVNLDHPPTITLNDIRNKATGKTPAQIAEEAGNTALRDRILSNKGNFLSSAVNFSR